MTIRRWSPGEEYPWDLLLLADPDRATVQGYLEGSILFLLDNGSIIGELVLQQQDLHRYEVMNLAVAPHAQRQGYGRLLLEHTIAWLGERAAGSDLIIKTGDIGHPVRLYRSMGFQQVAVHPDYFVRHYHQPIYEDGQRLRNQVVLCRKV